MSPVIAVAQLLDGVAGRTRESVETVLRSQGFGDKLKDRDVGFFVTLLDRAEILRYNRSSGAVTVLVHLARETERPPASSSVRRRRLAIGCGFGAYWKKPLESFAGFDKHFTSAASRRLWEAVDGNVVSTVRILSLYMQDPHAGKKSKRDYGNLMAELAARGVSLEWRVIDSTLIRDTHDRWVIGDKTARNIPNVNAIFSGQHSELNLSTQHENLPRCSQGYWDQSKPIEEAWVLRQGRLRGFGGVRPSVRCPDGPTSQ